VCVCHLLYCFKANLKYLKLSCICHLLAAIIFLSSFALTADFVLVILCVFCEVGPDFLKVLFSLPQSVILLLISS